MGIDSGTNPQPTKKSSENKLGVTGLISTTFNLWSRKLSIYIVIVGITGVALVLFQALYLYSIFGLTGFALLEFIGTSPLDAIFSLVFFYIPSSFLIPIIMLTLIGLIVYAIVAGAAIRYALIDYESPGSGNMSESLSFAWRFAVPLFGVQLLQSLIILGISALAVLSFYYQPIVSLGLIFAVLYIAVRLAPAPAIVIAEERPPINALSRSWQMTGVAFWHVFFGQLLMASVFMIVTVALSAVVVIGLVFIVSSLEMIILITTVFTSLLLSPLNYIFQAVIFKDLEARDISRDFNVL
ncbi:MAG: hypothetical protein KAU48_14335 [Candidatus Thorarchaeota archaeon]|nr:hypothetical protein [Candidatus Thorarchaeota archaeon]